MRVSSTLANRYQIRELLSQKAGRLTFLAQDLQTSALVIIKILRFGHDFHWDDLKLFEREALTLQNLDQPKIPKYLDYFEIDIEDTRGFALVQSYIEAPSLATHIASGRRFSETEVIELADKLLDILTYLHSQHPPIIHRDIKPSNILLTNRSGNSVGDVYLVDFGSVQMVARKEEGTITIVGSYGYIPLEQFGGQATMASDLYSLGMTLVYLLTGTHPAQLPQVNGQLQFTAEIDNNFRRWLDKMTYPHLDKRFDSARLAQVALKSEDGSYGDFNHLKPIYTKVQLYRDREKLEIRWRCIDQENSPGKLLTPLSWLSFLGGFVFPPLFVLIPIFVFAGTIIKACFGLVNYSLTIEQDLIYFSKSRSPADKIIILSKHPRSGIRTLAYNPGYTFDTYLDNDGKVMSRGQVTIPPKLYLYCNNFEYSLPIQLSRAEFWWLGKELSDFLNLELQVIYPTPKVPAAPSCGGGC
jgi:serine/threonine protein kinase